MNFIATIHGIYDDTKSQFAVFTATHPPCLKYVRATSNHYSSTIQVQQDEHVALIILTT